MIAVTVRVTLQLPRGHMLGSAGFDNGSCHERIIYEQVFTLAGLLRYIGARLG